MKRIEPPPGAVKVEDRLKSKRRHSGPALRPPAALEALAAMAGNTTYRIPIGGRGTQPGRTSLDIAGDLAVGSSRMTAGHAWGNIAVLIATSRPVSREEICDMVQAVIAEVAQLLTSSTISKLKAGKLRILLHMLIANATGPKATRKVAATKQYQWQPDPKWQPDPDRPDQPARRRYVPREVIARQSRHPDFRQSPGWLPTYTARASFLKMRRTEYSAIERELQSVMEAKIAEAAVLCGVSLNSDPEEN